MIDACNILRCIVCNYFYIIIWAFDGDESKTVCIYDMPSNGPQVMISLSTPWWS